MASHDDKLRTAEKKVKETTPAAKEDPKKVDPAADTPADPDMPAWAKAILDSNKKLTESVSSLQAEKALTTIQSQLKDKLKDVNPLVNWNDWKQPETDEEATAFVEKVTARSKEVDKTLTEKGLQALAAPKSSGDREQKTGVSAALKTFLEKEKAAAPQANSAPLQNSFTINTPQNL